MYNVSDAYKQTLNNREIKNKISGTITTQAGQIIAIDDSNILAGSLKISNQCTNGNNFKPGAVYAGQCGFTLFGIDVTRYTLRKASVVLNYKLNVGGSYETIPLGRWKVYEAHRGRKTITLTCYDAMLDADGEIQEEETTGTAYQMLSLVASASGLTLGTSQSAISAMPNSSIDLTLNPDDVDTYRDLLSYTCALLGAFATIGRDGNLYIRPFNNLSSVYTLSDSERTNSNIADYTTYYGIVKGKFIDEDTEEYIKTSMTATASGLTIDLGENPLIVGNSGFRTTVVGNLLNVFANLRYVPGNVEVIPDPRYDLGDMITVSNLNGTTDSASFLITKIDYTYHGGLKLTSEGADPSKQSVSRSSDKKAKATAKTEANKVAGSGDWIIIAANKLSDTQFTTTATNGKRNVTNTWNISETSTKTTFKNVTAGYDIEFTGW